MASAEGLTRDVSRTRRRAGRGRRRRGARRGGSGARREVAGRAVRGLGRGSDAREGVGGGGGGRAAERRDGEGGERARERGGGGVNPRSTVRATVPVRVGVFAWRFFLPGGPARFRSDRARRRRGCRAKGILNGLAALTARDVSVRHFPRRVSRDGVPREHQRRPRRGPRVRGGQARGTRPDALSRARRRHPRGPRAVRSVSARSTIPPHPPQ